MRISQKEKKPKSTLVNRYEEIYKRAVIDYSRKLPPPPSIIKIQNQIVGTLGNFSLITGKAKSKKTFAISLFLGSLEKSDESKLVTVGNESDDFEILYFDTEQSAHKVIDVAQRICKLNGVEVPYSRLKVFGLRPFSTAERLQIIDTAISIHSNAKFVVIDGIRDLVYSINSEEEATNISNYLLKWTAEQHIHIVTVLHQNKSKENRNARGHLGTELVNKAETVMSVEAKSDDVSIVKCTQARNKAFEPFAFKVNEEGLPEFDSSAEIKVSEGFKFEKKVDPTELGEKKLDEILKRISSHSKRFKYAELLEATKESVKKVVGESIGTDKAKAFKEYFEENEMIKKHGKDRSPNTYYTVT